MENNNVQTGKFGNLLLMVASNREKMGEIAARNTAKKINEMLKEKDEIRIVFAAAPSQNEFLYYLASDISIPWNRIVAFHMDEYIGLPSDSNELFAKYLTDHIFSKVNCKSVNLINSQTKDYAEECKRYEMLLKEAPIDIVCMGIGENGHIAFNDPPVADFNDPYYVKVIELDEKDKYQQVNDAGFNSINEVPSIAYSLTIPALFSGAYLNVVVPGVRKAEAVKTSLMGPVEEKCPASILRTHKNAVLFLDAESASLINL